jgi:HSP20 family protein
MTIWNFLKEMDQLQSQLGELAKLNSVSGWPRMSFLPGVSARHFPMMNISADDQNIHVEALAPGLDSATLKVTAVRDKLTISGEKATVKVASEKFHRNERSTGKFTRTIELPTQIDPDKVQAEYSNGILKITLPKADEAKPRQIEIKLN